MNNDVNSSMSLLSRIHSDAADFLTQRLAEKGLPHFASSHGFILFQLSLQDSLPMKDLAQRINRDKSTTTVLVRKLEQEGFIKSESSPEDARSKLISLTAKGRKYNEITAELSGELLKTFYKGFSEDEQQQVCGFLARIADNFEK
ncbi:MAG TPA: transcriptional regulator [Treponema sp.]|nr:transcriptional regulator [Treponema sp.]